MKVPPALRRALELCQGIPELKLSGDWEWHSSEERWALPFQLILNAKLISMPETTSWWAVVEERYPAGSVKIFPDAKVGVSSTWWHQSFNGDAAAGRPWRTGDLCVRTPEAVLGRGGGDTEPISPEERLAWNIQRAIDWLRKADAGTLAEPGDPYELPQFPGHGVTDPLVAFSASRESEEWLPLAGKAGKVEMAAANDDESVLALSTFQLPDGTRRMVKWGSYLEGRPATKKGAWIFLREPPIYPPWQAPATWKELKAACQKSGMVFPDQLEHLLSPLRGKERHILAVGFPIPARVGDPHTEVHWQCLLLPELPESPLPGGGFRKLKRNLALGDKKFTFADEKVINWLPFENWHPDRLRVRGGWGPEACAQRILLIGAGALGSLVAECLVRLGVKNLTIMDDENLVGGNLVRHALTMTDVGQKKAERLAMRLNQIHPYAAAVAIADPFPPNGLQHFDEIAQADIVLDCSGSDGVIRGMEKFPWPAEKLFLSLSCTYRFSELLFFAARGHSFPAAEFYEFVGPALGGGDANLEANKTWPREGPGCWHPAFPGNHDQLLALVGSGVGRLRQLLEQPDARRDAIVVRAPVPVGDAN